MICELCGKDVPRTKLVLVEGAAVSACPRCERFASSEAVRTSKGEVMLPTVAQRLSSRERRMRERDVYESGGEMDLALDYPERVRRARQRLSMSQDDLARRINEKKSVIVKIENGDMRPPDKLVAKLERALDISLREKLEPGEVSGRREYSRGMTLGDFIKYE